MCNGSNTQYLYPSKGEQELDTDNIAPPKTPDYCPKVDYEEILDTDDEIDSGNSPTHSGRQRVFKVKFLEFIKMNSF